MRLAIRALAATAATLALSTVAVTLAAPASATPEDGKGCAGLPAVPQSYVCVISATPGNAVPTTTTTTIPVAVPRICYVADCTGPTTVGVPVPGVQPGTSAVAVLWYQGVTYPIAVGQVPSLELVQPYVTLVTGTVNTALTTATSLANSTVTTATNTVGTATTLANGTVTTATSLANSTVATATTLANGAVTTATNTVTTATTLANGTVATATALANSTIATATTVAGNVVVLAVDAAGNAYAKALDTVAGVQQTYQETRDNVEGYLEAVRDLANDPPTARELIIELLGYDTYYSIQELAKGVRDCLGQPGCISIQQ